MHGASTHPTSLRHVFRLCRVSPATPTPSLPLFGGGRSKLRPHRIAARSSRALKLRASRSLFPPPKRGRNKVGVTQRLRERRVGRGAFFDQSNLHRRFAPKPTGGFRRAMLTYHSRFSAWRLYPPYELAPCISALPRILSPATPTPSLPLVGGGRSKLRPLRIAAGSSRALKLRASRGLFPPPKKGEE